MPDTNIQTAYIWATKLADTSNLRLSIEIPQAAQFVNKLNELIGKFINKDIESSGTGLFENFSIMTKDVIFHRLDDLCRNQLGYQISENQRISVALRLMSGCISAAKTIALETRDGKMTPDTRKQFFSSIDNVAMTDSIFCLGVESAPAYKKIHQQCYSFIGILGTSHVRKHSNEYLNMR
ncbi:MAG: hypothetical protein WA941_12290 [Nitrososphaeraceae archaeon]